MPSGRLQKGTSYVMDQGTTRGRLRQGIGYKKAQVTPRRRLQQVAAYPACCDGGGSYGGGSYGGGSYGGGSYGGGSHLSLPACFSADNCNGSRSCNKVRPTACNCGGRQEDHPFGKLCYNYYYAEIYHRAKAHPRSDVRQHPLVDPRNGQGVPWNLRPGLKKQVELKVGTWNVGSMTGRGRELVEEKDQDCMCTGNHMEWKRCSRVGRRLQDLLQRRKEYKIWSRIHH
eukprot:gene13467-4345_t